MTENVPSLVKKKDIQVPEVQRTPTRWTQRGLHQDTQNSNFKEHNHPYVHCCAIYICQGMEAAQVSISRSVDKTTRNIYTMEYYWAVKKNILPFATAWMDLKNIMLSEICQRKTNIIWFHSYVESNELTSKIETDS